MQNIFLKFTVEIEKQKQSLKTERWEVFYGKQKCLSKTMKWFVKLQRKYRSRIAIVARLAAVIISAVFSQTEKSIVAIAATVFFTVSISFTVFAVTANKSENRKRKENTFSESEKIAIAMRRKGLRQCI